MQDPFPAAMAADGLEVRRALRRDGPSLVSLWSDPSFSRMLPHASGPEVMPTPSYLASAASRMTKAGTLLVVEREGILMGTVNLYGHNHREPFIGWYVSPAFRGQGIALKAVEVVMSRLATVGAEAIHVGMRADNMASIRIAERLGIELKEAEHNGHLYGLLAMAPPSPGPS